jgi:hypothetical protein
MLSPNARNFVALNCGGRVTVTGKAHDEVRWSASRAVQLTLVDPTGKLDPLGGVHDVVTGVVPPVTVGCGYVTGTGLPVGV